MNKLIVAILSMLLVTTVFADEHHSHFNRNAGPDIVNHHQYFRPRPHEHMLGMVIVGVVGAVIAEEYRNSNRLRLIVTCRDVDAFDEYDNYLGVRRECRRVWINDYNRVIEED